MKKIHLGTFPTPQKPLCLPPAGSIHGLGHLLPRGAKMGK